VAISHFPSRTPLKSQDSKRLLQSGSFICSFRYRIESSLEKPSFLLVKHSALLSRVRRRSSSGRSEAVRSFTKCSHSYVTRNKASHGIAFVVSLRRTDVKLEALPSCGPQDYSAPNRSNATARHGAYTGPFESELTQQRERKAQERTKAAIDWRPRYALR
jgi:hypothetical protein